MARSFCFGVRSHHGSHGALSCAGKNKAVIPNVQYPSLFIPLCTLWPVFFTPFSSGTECVCLCGGGGSGEGFNLINAPLDESAASRLYPSITWTLSLRPALQSGCPASSAPPPGLRSGASAERCRSLPQTRH